MPCPNAKARTNPASGRKARGARPGCIRHDEPSDRDLGPELRGRAYRYMRDCRLVDGQAGMPDLRVVLRADAPDDQMVAFGDQRRSSRRKPRDTTALISRPPARAMTRRRRAEQRCRGRARGKNRARRCATPGRRGRPAADLPARLRDGPATGSCRNSSASSRKMKSASVSRRRSGAQPGNDLRLPEFELGRRPRFAAAGPRSTRRRESRVWRRSSRDRRSPGRRARSDCGGRTPR